MMLRDAELIRLCRGFALLLHSGIGLADGAFLLAREEQGSVKALLLTLGESMDSGSSLSCALEQSGAFPRHLWAMARVGETAGRLEDVLNSLAAYYETRQETRRQLRNAVAYPGTVLALMLLVIGVLLVKVLPVFEGVYTSLGATLGGAASLLLDLGRILGHALPVLFGVAVCLALSMLILYLRPELRQNLVRIWQRRFGDRGIGRKFNNAHFAQALALGFSAGLTPEQSVALAEELLQDVPGSARRCALCAKALQAGTSFCDALEQNDLLPAPQRRLLSIGLKSGSGQHVMETVARDLMEEAWQTLEQTVSAVEPAMVLVSSALVGLILLAVMLPLANILSVLG